VIINLFSSHLAANMGVKLAPKQIDTISDLLKTNIKIIITGPKPGKHKNSINQISKDIYSKINITNEIFENYVSLSQLMENIKWISGVSDGKYSISFYKIPLRMIVNIFADKLGDKCRFRYMDETMSLSIDMSALPINRRFDKQFRMKYIHR
jgi:hypothetical protein